MFLTFIYTVIHIYIYVLERLLVFVLNVSKTIISCTLVYDAGIQGPAFCSTCRCNWNFGSLLRGHGFLGVTFHGTCEPFSGGKLPIVRLYNPISCADPTHGCLAMDFKQRQALLLKRWMADEKITSQGRCERFVVLRKANPRICPNLQLEILTKSWHHAPHRTYYYSLCEMLEQADFLCTESTAN